MIDGLTLHKAVEFAVKTEELGQEIYEKLAKRFAQDPDIAEIFAILARDEVRHAKQFRELLAEVPDEELVSSQDGRDEYLRAMALSLFFMRRGGLMGGTDSIQDRTEALVRAFEMEKATVQYYEAMQDLLGANDTLKQIVKIERDHMLRLMKVLLADAKFRGLTDEI